MRVRDLITEGREPGEYVYHASFAGANGSKRGQLFRSILKQGLRPSQTGYQGPGVYFAYEPSEGYYHVSADDSEILRARWQDLVKLYGVYPSQKDGIQRDEDEILVPGPVPAQYLEVEYFPGEWWNLEDALGAETHHLSENFADGKVRGKSRPGRVKRAGASCRGSVTDLRAKAKKYGGEKGKMYMWCLNMKAGKK